MKKILSMLIMGALLLAMVAVSTSAAAYFEQGLAPKDTRITVRKATATIDGVISAGEYDEFIGYTEWYVAEQASDYFDEAGAMAQGAKWYFSWDGHYINIAVVYNAGSGANQTKAGGDYYGDYAFADSSDFVYADDFLGYGPGMNVKSAEVSPADAAWTKFFYAISENTATGEKMTGTYSNQNGQNQDYQASHDDFDFTYGPDGLVTIEYRVPIYELNEKFVENTPGMFQASITVQAGVYTEGVHEARPELYSWGFRLGQFGYNSDSGNLDKGNATFRLIADEIPNDGPVVDDTTAPDTTVPADDDTDFGATAPVDTTTPDGTTANGGATTPGTTVPGTTTPGATTPGTATPGATTPGTTTPGATTPGATTPGATTPGATTPGTTTPGATTPGTTTPGNANRPITGNGGNASQTADFGVVAALVSAISAAGVMISKKRR